jgi:hypothetical protein
MGDARTPSSADGTRAVPLSESKELSMRLYTHLFRLAVLASLVATALVCGGWKWEGLPH